MSNLLVTGGAGFIGANFVRHWIAGHPEDRIVVLDSLTYAGRASNLFGLTNVELIVDSIENSQRVEEMLREREISILINFAAETHVDRSITAPDRFIETNIVGTHSLLKAARKVWLSGDGLPHRFHQVSTDEVYGSLELQAPPFLETSPYAPNSPYSASKAASDHLVRAYQRTYGLQATLTRSSNNYGPFQFPEKLVPFFIKNSLLGKPLPIYGDGGAVRDWLHVYDHCRALELVLERGRAGEAYNVSGGVELTTVGLADMLCSEIDRFFERAPDLAARFPDAPATKGKLTSTLKRFVTDRLGHDRRYSVGTEKIAAELGFAPNLPLESGLRETINWYLTHQSWWQS